MFMTASIPWINMEDNTNDDYSISISSHFSCMDENIPCTYENVLTAFRDPDENAIIKTVSALQPFIKIDNGCVSQISDPNQVLKVVAAKLRESVMSRYNVNMNEYTMPFRMGPGTDTSLAGRINSCPRYAEISQAAYGGVFVCHRPLRPHILPSLIGPKQSSSSGIIRDIDLMAVFAVLMAIRTQTQRFEERIIRDALNMSILQMSIIADKQKEWPLSYATNTVRDQRIFTTLAGVDATDGVDNKWCGVFESIEDQQTFFNHGDDSEIAKTPDCGVRVYTGKALYDAVLCLSLDERIVIFGAKVAHVLQICCKYSTDKNPFLLSSDPTPVYQHSHHNSGWGARVTENILHLPVI
uniref:Uncharacterized protein n=1 Tax=Chionoecetes opilio bacilliform virus TaxID=1825681 RepID=A0A1Q3DLD8_9VIRU|nr:hypothetical protein SCV_019 [Chionoecetes opilio bacilliform virus]